MSMTMTFAAAAVAGVGSAWLLGRGTRTGLSAGVLLLVFAIAFGAVGLQTLRMRGIEAKPDLSARIGLGVLGGALGALAATVAAWALTELGIQDLFRVSLPGPGAGADWAARIWLGVLWGLALGIVFPRIFGRTFISRGITFSLLPSLWLLLKVFPLDYGVGLFGEGYGALTFVFVLGYGFIWGIITAATVEWGARTSLAPVSHPLVE
jgi:hypothetical protein